MDFLVKFLLSFLIAIPFVNINAQNRILKGQIFDAKTSKPIKGIEVLVKNCSKKGITNIKGIYKIVIPDSITNVEFLPFEDRLIVEVEKISQDEINIWLSELSITDVFDMTIEELLKIKVSTASKNEEEIRTAPAIITVVTAKELEKYGSRYLTDVLDRVAGTFVYGSYYLPNNMVTIRGEVTSHYANHVLLLINGRPLRSSKTGYLLPVIRSLPLESIDRLEVLRGPGSALYGSGAYTGVINIITKKGNEQRTSASLNYGSFETVDAAISTGIEKNDFALSMAAFYMNSKGWDYKVRGALIDSLYPATNTPAIENSSGITIQANYKNFTFNSYWGLNYQMIGQMSQKWWYADEWYLGTVKGMTDLGYSHEFSSKMKSDINITYNYLKYWQPYDVHANDFREWGIFNDIMLELTNFYKPSSKLSITFGGVTSTNTGHIQNTETLFDGTPYNVWLMPKNPAPFYVVPKYNETWWNVYSTINYDIFDFFKLNVGAHANKVSNLPLDISPRIAAVFSFETPITIKLLYGEAYRSADYFELYSRVRGIYGNKFLKPEEIATYEAQFSYSYKLINISVAAFNSSQKNVIGRSLASDSLLIINGISEPMFVNSNELNSYGVELEGIINLSDNLNVSFSALYHENENSEDEKNVYGLANTFIKTGVHYSLKNRLNIGLFNMWVSKGNEFDAVYTNANPTASSFHYLTFKLSADLKKIFHLPIKPNLVLNFTGFNLLDEGIYYPEYDSRIINTIPGRSGKAIYCGLKIEY